jgi:purine-binding chemotaxis protein CheW
MEITEENREHIKPLGDQQIVALHLGQEVYGVNISIIHTVIIPQSITEVPRTPSYVKGVMNLRGQIIPVIDLRLRLELAPLDTQDSKTTRIVIVDTEGVTAGLIVDAVSEVLTLSEDSIEPPSGLVANRDTEFITGIGRMPKDSNKPGSVDRLILLIDIHRVLTSSIPSIGKSSESQKVA